MGAMIDLCCERDTVPKSSKHKRLKQIQVKKDLHPTQGTSLQQTCPIQHLKESPQKLQQQKIQEQQDQFYDIDEFVQQRQKSNLQPLKITHNSFQILGLIGQGAFGSVFLVQFKDKIKRENGIKLAMKRIPRQLTCSQKVMDSLKLQRHILANSTNPFITSLKYAFTDRHYLYLVMQFAQGGDAGRFISKGQLQKQFSKLGNNGVRFLLACTVLGLQYLHSQQIVYRDLKPQNILLFSNGYAKLSDFGLVRALPDQHVKLKTHAGTALYNAPEMVLQQGYAKPADLWALGVLAYELATGQTPFKLEDVITKLRFKRVAQEEEIKRQWRGHELGAALTDFVGQLLRFKPQERLGVRGWYEIKVHEFFNGFDWKALSEGVMDSPLGQIVRSNHVQVKVTKQVAYSSQQKYSELDNDDDGWSFDYQK